MNYENKYKKAFEIAKSYWESPRTCINIDVLKEMFPELDESDNDQKMLDQIISIIEDADDSLVRPENVSIYTNWLKSRYNNN